MISSAIRLAVVGVLTASSVQASPLASERHETGYGLRPYNIDLSKGVSRMIGLVKDTQLPKKPEYPNLGSKGGIDLDVLKGLQQQWLTDFDWKKEQASFNQFKHFTAKIEGLDIHFVHEKSSEPNAIPLILSHGWPGSFLEFAPVLNQLTKKGKTANGKPVSFDVIVPSLPGYAFSSAPPENWTIDDTARVFNTLMTEVLGYKTYAAHGTDLGAGVTYSLYDNFNKTNRAAHLVFLPFFPPTPEELAAQNITLSPLEQFEEERYLGWGSTGNAYFLEHTTKPNTIGLALYDNPVGQLAWIAEKFIDWSDPRAGTGPSALDHNEIILSVSLYYLTKTFVSSVFMYAQNPNGFKTVLTKARTDAPLLFSAFKYNVGFWPPAIVARTGNLVSYKNHEFGGHFPGLDNPSVLIEDLREIRSYWQN